MLIFYSSVFLLLISARRSVSLECYTCEKVTDPDDCHNITPGSSNQSCYASVNSSGSTNMFSLGITNNKNCGDFPHFTNTVSKKDEDNDCFECCSKDKCNNRLCQHLKPSKCIDDVKVDCAHMNEMFDICKNVNESKKICPKFCGLCSLVDGNWADWSLWSPCDVTCDSGTQTRIRTCTNPAPAHFGMQCIGNATETRPCDNILCPVDGGWSKWSDWGTCSVTCDSGLKKRNRSCSNPYPTQSGNHCFGDSTEVDICIPGPCVNETPFYAFRAHTASDKTLANNKVLVFTITTLNIGDAYNNKTGVFVAPVTGLYQFTAQICMSASGRAYFGFSIGGKSEANIFAGDVSYHRCNSFDTVSAVNKGEHVSVKCVTGSDSADNLWEYVYATSSFSGTILHTIA